MTISATRYERWIRESGLSPNEQANAYRPIFIGPPITNKQAKAKIAKAEAELATAKIGY